MPFTLGDLRAAIDGQPDHITIEVPIPLATIDGGPGHEYAPVTGINVAGDTADLTYTEPYEWTLNGAAERRDYTADRKYAAAYLASSHHGISDAVRMALEVRISSLTEALTAPGAPELPEAARTLLTNLADTLHDDITVVLAGAAARNSNT